jgi:putative peptide zinc metalloprotease protein
MALGGVITWAVVPVYKVFNYLLLDPELHRKRVPATAFVLAVCATVVAVVGFVPTPVHYSGTAVLLPAQKSVLYADTPGFVTHILRHDGELVKAGDPILVCENLDEEAQYRSIQKEIAVVDAQMKYEMDNHPEEYPSDVPYRQRLVDDLKDAQLRLNALVVTAPQDGLLIAPDLDHVKGKFFQKGEALGITVARMDQCLADGFLDERDMALPFLTASGKSPDSAEIRLAGAPGKKLVGSVEAWGAAAVIKLKPELASLTQQSGNELVLNAKDPNGNTLDKPQFPVLVRFDNTDKQFYTGQTVYLRFDLGKRPLIWQWYRRLGQLMQTHSSSNKWL